MKQRTRTKIDMVDLFCGAGGLSYGMRSEGISIRAGFDIDPACEWPFKANVRAPFYREDVAELSGRSLRQHFRNSRVRLLAGCAPCQKFSNYTQRSAPTDRQRWKLVDSFARIALELKPDLITMENVPGLSRHRRFKAFLRALESAGYAIWYGIVEGSEYGMPQYRQRLVVLASRLGPIRLLTPGEYGAKPRTVEHAIGGLPRIRAGQVDRRDTLHRASLLSHENMKRIRASRPGGTWRDWPEKLVLPCHRKSTGSGYPSVYGRMEWSKPAPTITTLAYNYGSGRFGHPSQNRALSLREAALLQTFPRNYAFVAPRLAVNVRAVGTLIGNAVPVELGRIIGRSIREHVKSVQQRKQLFVTPKSRSQKK